MTALAGSPYKLIQDRGLSHNAKHGMWQLYSPLPFKRNCSTVALILHTNPLEGRSFLNTILLQIGPKSTVVFFQVSDNLLLSQMERSCFFFFQLFYFRDRPQENSSLSNNSINISRPHYTLNVLSVYLDKL